MDLEAEYDNRARVPDHAEIMAEWQFDASAFRAGAKGAERDVAYGPSPRQQFDLFWPAEPHVGAPLGLFIHGGYWRSLDRSMFSHVAGGLGAHGIAVAVAGYDLCPDVALGAILDQMRAACRVLWEAHGRRLLVYGHSAGGHLAACLLATDWAAQGLPDDLVIGAMSVSGLFDLTPLLATSINDDLRLDEGQAERLSPVLWPAPEGARFVAAVGARESDEFLRQSRDIVRKWGAAGVATRLREVERADHFSILAPLADADSPLVRDLLALAEGRMPD